MWGPLAHALVGPLASEDFSHEGFGYSTAERAYIGHVLVTAMRLSYLGELGWELYTSADLGLRLWDTLWRAGPGRAGRERGLGLVAAGHIEYFGEMVPATVRQEPLVDPDMSRIRC